MTAITVEGVGERHLTAERATLSARIAIAHVDRERSIALGTSAHSEVASRALRLREAGAATWHSVDPLTTTIRVWTDKDGVKHQDHVTGGTVHVKLRDLRAVADVVAELSTLGATVSTDWVLTEATRDRTIRELRATAVNDARSKAADFAAALGGSVQRVSTLRESGGGGGPAVRGSSGGARDELTVPEITVRVAVVGEFETD